MASPQVENGHTQIANELLEALARIRIPGEARQIFDAIIRKTYGWKKTKDKISLPQLVEMTGIKKPNVIRGRKTLIKMNLITVIESDNDNIPTYRIQKDYTKWKSLSKTIMLSKAIPTKETNIHIESNINKKKDENDIYKKQVKEILDYFNGKTGKHFRVDPNNSIKARLREHGIEACKKVIDIKTVQWLDDSEHNKYLRPETLFRPSKFDSYLNETIVPSPIEGWAERTKEEKDD